MKKSLPHALLALTFIAVVLASYISIRIISLSNQRQDLSYDLAELSHIKYGILNPDLWKEKAALVLKSKLETFALEGEQRQQIKGAVEYALGQMVNELDSFMLKDSAKNDWSSKIKNFVHENALQPINLRAKIPAIAERTIQELDKEEVQKNLRKYIGQQIDQLMEEADRTVDESARKYILKQYGLKEIQSANKALGTEILSLQTQIWKYSYSLITIVLLGFLFWWFSPQNSWPQFIGLGLLTITLLLAGILTPMLDIDARIVELYFKLLGEEIRFEDQILFFQSKSIVDVVYLLIFKADYSSLFVGILILTFSVIFPLAKLISAIFAFRYLNLLNKNPIIHFLVLKSGKWSMADVMVVAIFMAYIGFKGILKGQLEQLETVKTVDILTTHQYTSLQAGILLFTAFCLASLFMAVFMQKRLNQLNDK